MSILDLLGFGRGGPRAAGAGDTETVRRIVRELESLPPERATNATGQFDIADGRSAEEIATLIRRLGYEPVWKDWDAALAAERN